MTYPNAEDRFGPIVSLWTSPASAMRDELVAWMPEYLAAHERQEGLEAGLTPTLRSIEIRHAAEIRPQAQLPAAVVWIGGASGHTIDPADGTVRATVQLGIYLVVGAKHAAATGELLHRYVAAVRALFWDRPSLRGTASPVSLTDEDYTRIEIRKDGVRQSGALSFAAANVELGRAGAGPGFGAGPRPDPRPPLPGDPTYLDADVTVTPTINPLDPN